MSLISNHVQCLLATACVHVNKKWLLTFIYDVYTVMSTTLHREIQQVWGWLLTKHKYTVQIRYDLIEQIHAITDAHASVVS